MKLKALRLHNVRRFAGRGVAIEGVSDGVNVLSAHNEYGKSTCFDALHALFFQPHTGTPGAVQALRPYSGGSPLVEADIATSDGRFRLSKQFYAGRRAMVRELDTGRLVAQADEAERFIAGLVHGGTTGPAGLLWVRQGLTGIERRAKSDEEGEKRARETVLTSVQGEVESLTGGRRMAQAVAACEEELSVLVTAGGKARAGGPYAQAVQDCARLAQEETRLAAEVAGLRAALDRRRAIRARLTELDEPAPQAQRLRDLEQAEAEWAAARAHGDALKRAEAEEALARNRCEAAAASLSAFRGSRERLTTLRGLHEDGLRGRDVALERQRHAAAVAEQAEIAVEAAERSEREALELLGRLDKALRARQASESLAALRDAHGRAEAARADIEAIDAELVVLALPAAEIRRLEAIEAELVGLRAVAAARMPVIRVDYREGGAGAVSIDGAPLADGEERPLGRNAAFDIAGVGRISLSLPQGDGSQEALAKAQASHQALLDRLRIASLADARQRESLASERKVQRDLARQRLALLAPQGLPALREAIAQLLAVAGDGVELKGDPEAARSALVQAEAAVASSRHAARQAQPLRAAADKAIVAAETALAGLAAEMTALAATLGAEPDRAGHEAGLARNLANAQQILAAASEQAGALRSSARDVATAEARLRRMRSMVDGAAAETARLREDLAELNGQIQARSDAAVEEAWQEAIEARASAGKHLARFEKEVALLTRLRDALEAARASAREHYFAPVMRELRPLLGLLFEDASVTFDEDTLLPRSVLRNGLEEAVGVLSGGMREQLTILTRLAFAQLLAREGQPAPVILDDALVYSDDDRIERMFDALHRQASSQQIIVFSCRQRAFSQLGGTILTMKDWTPQD